MNLKFSWVFKLGCFSMFALVGLGAKFGHMGRLTPESTTQFNKAQMYHLVNNVGLLTLALSGRAVSLPGKVALGGFIGGLLAFCLPMYYISVYGKNSYLSKAMPVGGMSILLGWGALAFA